MYRFLEKTNDFYLNSNYWNKRNDKQKNDYHHHQLVYHQKHWFVSLVSAFFDNYLPILFFKQTLINNQIFINIIILNSIRKRVHFFGMGDQIWSFFLKETKGKPKIFPRPNRFYAKYHSFNYIYWIRWRIFII